MAAIYIYISYKKSICHTADKAVICISKIQLKAFYRNLQIVLLFSSYPVTLSIDGVKLMLGIIPFRRPRLQDKKAPQGLTESYLT